LQIGQTTRGLADLFTAGKCTKLAMPHATRSSMAEP
jgi:hypothetical protein